MMKSHDCHVLMTSILPVAIRNVLPVKVRETVMSLCFFFNAIEQKVIDDYQQTTLDRQLHETLCLMEVLPSDVFRYYGSPHGSPCIGDTLPWPLLPPPDVSL